MPVKNRDTNTHPQGLKLIRLTKSKVSTDAEQSELSQTICENVKSEQPP